MEADNDLLLTMLYDRQYARGLKGLNRGRTFSSSCYNLHLQSVVGGRPQVGHYKQVMILQNEGGEQETTCNQMKCNRTRL